VSAVRAMTGRRILDILRASHAAVLRTHGIDPRSLPLDELARNAAAIILLEIEAEKDATVDTADKKEP
jgi:hypothetical protein